MNSSRERSTVARSTFHNRVDLLALPPARVCVAGTISQDRYTRRGRGRTVNPLSFGTVGSSPTLSTILEPERGSGIGAAGWGYPVGFSRETQLAPAGSTLFRVQYLSPLARAQNEIGGA